MKNIKLNIPAFILIFLLLIGCGEYYQSIDQRNFAHQYNPMLTAIHPVTLLHRVAKDSSVIFIQIPVTDIEFPEIHKRQDQLAGIKVKYFVVDSAGAQTWRDSGSMQIIKPQKPATNYMQFQLGVKHHPDSSKFIDLHITDMLGGNETREVLRILPDNPHNKQRFLSYYNNREYPLIRHFAAPGDSVQVNYSPGNDSLWVFHLTYNRFDSLPFDTLYKTGQANFFHFNQRGSYIINTDSSLTGGLRYYASNQYFPAIKKPKQMLGPIRYLVNSKEWSKINKKPPKKAVDTFWLVAAKTPEKARNLIQTFYNRVQLSNIKFSNHSAGWKTQMGKTITLAGLPDEVQITDTSENWYYFIKKNEKLQVPFIYNQAIDEFQLNRNDSLLHKFLYFHINQWRMGAYK